MIFQKNGNALGFQPEASYDGRNDRSLCRSSGSGCGEVGRSLTPACVSFASTYSVCNSKSLAAARAGA